MPADFHCIRYRAPKYSWSVYRALMSILETSLGFGASESCKKHLDGVKYGYEELEY